MRKREWREKERVSHEKEKEIKREKEEKEGEEKKREVVVSCLLLKHSRVFFRSAKVKVVSFLSLGD